MNRIIRSKLSIITVLLILSMPFVSCGYDPWMWCYGACAAICSPFLIVNPWASLVCFGQCSEICPPLQGCEDNPDDCAAMFELYEAAMEVCEEYPEECQQAFDSWVESLDTAEE